jgi:hypothetical protein
MSNAMKSQLSKDSSAKTTLRKNTIPLSTLDEARARYQNAYKQFDSHAQVADLLSEKAPESFPARKVSNTVSNLNRDRGGYETTRMAVEILETTIGERKVKGRGLSRQKLTLRK